jgi:murein DD-endopeptidase MepM/ murein hydrolase activator NlpD
MMKLIKLWPLALTICGSALAADCAVFVPTDLTQGQLVKARVPKGAIVSFQGRVLQQTADAEVVFGLAYNAPKLMHLYLTGACTAKLPFNVSQRSYRVEKVNGLPPKTVTPDPETAKRVAAEGKLITEGRAIASDLTYWRGDFVWPAFGRQSGIYGSQRILNGIPGSPHLGLDMAAPAGTEVRASLPGTVTLLHEDMVMTGKTILIDHGFGISTIYIHLSKIDIKLGDTVKAGQKIGAIGSTGRSTGPHLHFQVQWFQEKLDPALVLPAK